MRADTEGVELCWKVSELLTLISETKNMKKTLTPGKGNEMDTLLTHALSNRRVVITGQLEQGKNGNSGRFMLRGLGLTVVENSRNAHVAVPAESLPTGIVECTVPDSAFSAGLNPGKMISPEGLVKWDFFQKLPPNTCTLLKGADGGSKTGKLILAVKKGDMLRIVLRPKGEADEGRNIQPKNIEQAFAIDLLTDPKIKLVVLYGPGGTGKTVTAIMAGLKLSRGFNARSCEQPVLGNVGGDDPIADSNPSHVTVVRPVCPIGKELVFARRIARKNGTVGTRGARCPGLYQLAHRFDGFGATGGSYHYHPYARADAQQYILDY